MSVDYYQPMVFSLFLRFAIRLLILTLVIIMLLWGVEAVLPKQGILLFSTPIDFAPAHVTFRNEVEWQTRLFDVRTGIWLPVYVYRKTLLASAFHWSPDGHHIAGSPMNVGSVVVDVYRKDLPFTVDKGYTLAWSYAGDQFAVMKSENGNYHAYIGKADGSDLKRLDTTLKNNMFPSWSPDDSQIAVVDEKSFSIYTINLNSGEPKQLTSSGSINDWDRMPVWSPDGQSMAYVQSVHTADHNGNTLLVVDMVHGQTRFKYENSVITSRAFWSPDSRYIAFIAAQKDKNEDDLYILDTLQGGSVHKLIDNVYYVYDVPWEMWSPDGRYIAFSHMAQTANHQPTPAAELNLVEVATGSIIKIADVAAAFPVWQPQ